MRPRPSDSDEMSQDDEGGTVHLSRVDAEALISDPTRSPPRPPAPASKPVLDPAARTSRRLFEGLSMSSAGLELGISVGLGALFGAWLDGKFGTGPWVMVGFLVLGVVAGVRGVTPAVA